MLPLSAGSADFEGMFVWCTAGGKMAVQFRLQGSVVSSNSVVLFFRTCYVGEYFRDGECRVCETGFYSKRTNGDLAVTQCERCPDSATYCNGSTISLRPGYWAVSEASPSILECPMGANACPGGVQRRSAELQEEGTSLAEELNSLSAGVGETASSLAGCREGYLGQLCAVCAEDFFYHAPSNTCASCEGGGHGTALALLVLALLFPLALLLRLAADRHRGSRSEFSQLWEDEGVVTACVFRARVWWAQQRQGGGECACSALLCSD